MTYQKITEYLHELADPAMAKHLSYFFKTAEGQYGFGDKFLGIRVPVVRRAAKKFSDTPLSVVKKLVRSEYHEIRLFSLLLLVLRFPKATLQEQENIYQLYLANTKYINNWDLVDLSAHYIVGIYLEDKDRSKLYELAESPLLWDRRIAIVATWYFIRKNDFKDTLGIAELLINDREDLIHKAVGWMLREVGKRDLEIEQEFLKTRYRKMPRTMLRYAIEKFNEPLRKKYLKGEV